MASDEPIVIYAMPGSQFTAKVIVALDAFEVQHYVSFVPADPAQRKLPGGGRLVPLLQCGDDVVVPDSEAILHWLDEHRGTRCFAHWSASEESLRASEGVLSGAVLYYNWVNPEGYGRSMRAMFSRQVPWFVPIFRESIVDYAVAGKRAEYRTDIVQRMSIGPELLEPEHEPEIRARLLAELEHFQGLLEESGGPYLLGEALTAADCSVFAQVERLVGDMGDVGVACSLPGLKDDNDEDDGSSGGGTAPLRKLWEWHGMMRERHPVRFKGKRRPKV